MAAELPTTKPTIADFHWADGGSPETTTEPGEPLKDAGYATSNPGVIPLAAHWNWLLKLIGEIFAWFDRAIIRRFSSPVDAVTNVEADGLACIQTPYSATVHGRWTEIQQITTGKTIGGFCSDGLYLYITYPSATEQAFAAWRADLGTQVWETVSDGDADGPDCICTDGAYLYTVYQDPDTAAQSIRVYNVADGTVKQTVAMHTAGAIYHIACNGKQVLITTGTLNHEVEIYEWVDGTLTYSAECDLENEDDITALYCGPSLAAVGFSPDANSTLAVVFDFSGASVATLDTSEYSTEPTIITGITSDGDGLLLSSDECQLTLSHSTSVLTRWYDPFISAGAWKWTGMGGSLEGGPVVTDGRIAVVLGANSVTWYDCRTLTVIGYLATVKGTAITCDGYRLHVLNGSNIYQYYMGYDARIMRVCNTSDVNRVPLQGSRIVPVE